MLFNKMVSVIAIVSQLGLVSGALANTTTTATAITTSPEQALLEKMIALDGSVLSHQQIQAQVQTEVSAYARSANSAGQMERFQAATVAMGIYTQNQAASVFSDVSRMTANMAPTAENVALVTRAIVTMHPAGAQFSGVVCAGLGVGILASLAAFIGVIVVVSGGNNSFSSTDHPVAADVEIGLLSAAGLGAVLGAVGCL